MGKMILDDLRKRLERLDEDADLMIDNNDRYQMVIVGGSAFILLGKLTRATHDIDALSVPKELYSLLGKYDINTDVEAYIDNFPYNFQDRLQPLPFGGTKVQFYTPSLEDLVIAKLCSFRDTDKADVESEAVRNSLDWDLLEHLATDEDELRASILNDWRYRDFYIRYQEYVQNQENTTIPLLEKQLREVDKKLDNLMKAIEDGLYTRTTKERLEALEIQKDELTVKIADEKLKKPSFNEDFIRFWLMKFRKFDISQKKQRKALIEIFVNAIFLYDDRMLITFNYKDGAQTVRFEDTLTADSAEEKSSDLSSSAGP